jgi:hypothetical protein
MKCAVLLVCFLAVATAKTTPEANACEVCVDVLTQIGSLLDAKGKKKMSKVEKAIGKYCKNPDKQNKALNSKQKKMCYYFDPIKKLVSRPFSIGMPLLKVCQKLKNTNPEICEVKYPPKVDLATTDFKKMRVKQLKGLLAEHGVNCDGCVEKEDYVKKVKSALGKKEDDKKEL